MEGSQKPLAGTSDEELVRACAAGDELAFARLVQRYTPLIRAQSHLFRVSASEYEDLEQEGLMGLLFAVRSFDETDDRRFRPFALTCCRNRMLTLLRQRHAAEHEVPDGEEALAALSDDGLADPVRWLLQREEAACLRDWLQDRLSPMEYKVLLLFLNAYTYEEIASSLSITEKTVDNALQRVRRKLGRDLLD